MKQWEEVAASARVLVIDDDRSALHVLEAVLTRGGYRHIAAVRQPEQALETFRRVRPDLVITDLRMSPIDGFEVLRQLREQLGAEEYLPIMIVSGDISDEAKRSAVLLGAKDFIAKPFDLVETLLRVRIQLETRFRFQELVRKLELLRGPYGD